MKKLLFIKEIHFLLFKNPALHNFSSIHFSVLTYKEMGVFKWKPNFMLSAFCPALGWSMMEKGIPVERPKATSCLPLWLVIMGSSRGRCAVDSTSAASLGRPFKHVCYTNFYVVVACCCWCWPWWCAVFTRTAQASCLGDEPKQIGQYKYPEQLPGQLYDADTQCKWQFGSKVKLCSLDFVKVVYSSNAFFYFSFYFYAFSFDHYLWLPMTHSVGYIMQIWASYNLIVSRYFTHQFQILKLLNDRRALKLITDSQ